MALRHQILMGLVDQFLLKKMHHFHREPVLTATYIQITLTYPRIHISVTLIHPDHFLVTLIHPSQMVVTLTKMTNVKMIKHLCILMAIKVQTNFTTVPGGGNPRKPLIQLLQQPALVPEGWLERQVVGLWNILNRGSSMVKRVTMYLTQPSVTLTLLTKLTVNIWDFRNEWGILLTSMLKWWTTSCNITKLWISVIWISLLNKLSNNSTVTLTMNIGTL